LPPRNIKTAKIRVSCGGVRGRGAGKNSTPFYGQRSIYFNENFMITNYFGGIIGGLSIFILSIV